MIVTHTLANPNIIERYRKDKADENYIPLSHEDLAAVEGMQGPDWDGLLAAVCSIPTGNEHADAYERAIEALLTALFYLDLTNPNPQTNQHDGRKRIDIQYTNMATAGFFYWLAKHYPSGLIHVECKNFGGEIANPELDQLSSRFSPSRGQVGILVCRAFKDKGRFEKRCWDTCTDQRGYILALDDQDLSILVDLRKSDQKFQNWPLLKKRFDALVNKSKS